MVDLNITFKILENKNQIKSLMKQAVFDEMSKYIISQKGNLLNQIQSLVRSRLEQSPEIISLKDSKGKLRVDFGIYAGSDPTKEVIDAILSSIIIDINNTYPNSGTFVLLTIYIQPTTFANLIGQAFGIITYPKGSHDWLDWLLTLGNKIIIKGWHVYEAENIGRSGGAIMLPDNKKVATGFKVDSRYSGTVTNNFITRALDNTEDDIARILEGILS